MGLGTCRFKFLPEGTIELWFDSVWMGVTGGAMVGATFRGLGEKYFMGSEEGGIYNR